MGGRSRDQCDPVCQKVLKGAMDMEFSLIHEPNSSIIKFASISKAHPLQWDSWMSSAKEIDPAEGTLHIVPCVHAWRP